MSRPLFQICMTQCERCGKPLATTSRSIYGLDNLKAKWGNLCSACTTAEEKMQLLKEQGEALIKELRK